MRKLLVAFLVAMLVLPMAFAVSVGSGIGIDITPEDFPPMIWLCDSRIVMEDPVEAGRMSNAPEMLAERIENYAFEGEQIQWEVLVMDKNKIEEVIEVVGTMGETQGAGNLIEVECVQNDWSEIVEANCSARILEEDLTGETIDPLTQQYYQCTFTVETPASMQGEYFITVEAIGSDGQSDIMDENEYWYLNPIVSLGIDGDLVFTDVRQGSVAYSSTLLIENDDSLSAGSGVMLDMFISGTDFYDPADSGARCPTTNHLKLSQNIRQQSLLGAGILSSLAHTTTPCSAGAGGLTSVDDNDHLCYYAVNGAYNTCNGDGAEDNADAECYRPIVYSDEFTRDFYNDAEIIANDVLMGIYDAGNVLSPGAEISITFKLGLPEPCVGDFSEGDIYFWGEAI